MLGVYELPNRNWHVHETYWVVWWCLMQASAATSMSFFMYRASSLREMWRLTDFTHVSCRGEFFRSGSRVSWRPTIQSCQRKKSPSSHRQSKINLHLHPLIPRWTSLAATCYDFWASFVPEDLLFFAISHVFHIFSNNTKIIKASCAGFIIFILLIPSYSTAIAATAKAQSDTSYPPENCDLASAAGVMTSMTSMVLEIYTMAWLNAIFCLYY